MEVNPIAVILVYMDSKGDRLLFRYPYDTLTAATDSVMGSLGSAQVVATNPFGFNQVVTSAAVNSETKKRNPYAINNLDDLLQTPPQSAAVVNAGSANSSKGQLFADEVLSALFAVKQQLCNQKFELKVNDVRFVAHPTLIQRREQRQNLGNGTSAPSGAGVGTQMLVNIAFALHAQASYSIVKCYYELSKRLGLALKVEEQRVGYFTEETMLMARTHDEISSQQQPLERAFDLISEHSNLAQALKSIYHDLCTTGLLNTTLNQSLTLSFCLPQKAHQLHKRGSMVDPATIDRCLRALKPYHGMLLLVDFAELLDCVPPSGTRMLLQLVDNYTPLKSLQMLASQCDLSIEHVYKLVSHLVYWGKVTVIYPLCETNVYVIAPDAPLHTNSHLVRKFATRFAGLSLFEVISDFSLPTSIGHLTTPLQQPARQSILAQMVLWMLQHHLLMQLHTYVQFMPSDLDDYYTEAGDMKSSVSLELDEGVNLSRRDIISGAFNDHCERISDDDDGDNELNDGSLMSCTSQPLPVPNISRRTGAEDHYSADGSTASDNIAAQPSSSHKSNFSMTVSISTGNSISSVEDEEKVKELLQTFDGADRAAIRRIPASTNVDDLSLMVKLYQAGYFKSEHHLEEIMYFESLRGSQLLQLLDKFRDVLIIYETEDPAIASMYSNE